MLGAFFTPNPELVMDILLIVCAVFLIVVICGHVGEAFMALLILAMAAGVAIACLFAIYLVRCFCKKLY
jgi:hypothetical protein